MTGASRAMRLAAVMWIAACVALSALASDTVLETIQIRHRPAAELVAVIEPMLSDDAVVRAHRDQLIVRASPSEIAEVRALLRRLDRPLARLRITARLDRVRAREETDASARARIGSDSSSARARVRGAEREDRDTVTQRVQVLEGEQARLHLGAMIPYVAAGGPNGRQATTAYHATGTILQARPHLREGRVTLALDLRARSSPRDRDGRMSTGGVRTTVSGPLGEWLEVGATGRERASHASGILFLHRISDRARFRLQVKVERRPRAR